MQVFVARLALPDKVVNLAEQMEMRIHSEEEMGFRK